ncbi:MAG: DUF2848 domain-containing protein [Neisseriaceae bacterium]|nr:DUF2848 domain-containing protein [Neisseriaceae bacterium]
MSQLALHVVDHGSISFQPTALIIGGWAGRDPEAVNAHIKELQEMGVTPPSKVPCFYPLAPSLLTNADRIDVPRKDSSGEVECVLFNHDGVLYVGVGSDHTDRKAEAYDVTVSKQMCAKPFSDSVWRFADVAAHWDQLQMRCYRTLEGVRSLYQEGSVTSLLHPLDLIEKWSGQRTLDQGQVMFCGTQSVMGQLGYGEAFEVVLHDPVLGRSLCHAYQLGYLAVDES